MIPTERSRAQSPFTEYESPDTEGMSISASLSSPFDDNDSKFLDNFFDGASNDQSAAADEEQYMLILDERLSSNNGVPGAANPADNDGQAGSASWEPRFERFKAIESIKLQSVENKKKEKMQLAEQVKRQQQEGEAWEKARQEAIKRLQRQHLCSRLNKRRGNSKKGRLWRRPPGLIKRLQDEEQRQHLMQQQQQL